MLATPLAVKILTSVFGGAVQALARDRASPAITPHNANEVEKALVEKAAQIPEIVNLNAEPKIASRVLWGLGVAGSGATGVASVPIAELAAAVAGVLKAFGIDFPADEQAVWVEAGNSAVTIVGLLYAFYGRLWPGLAPMWPRISRLWARLTS